ncbi:MAG TPA: amidohydrolase family protein, partial [Acidimicrobiales bacterium]|nr:amidohydrolase family protein [Acidimicrobiales bacterium]
MPDRTVEIPPIVSVDDHVIEPPDLWERWLPARHRDHGPRVVRARWEMVPSGRQGFRKADDGPGADTDFWVYGRFSAGIDAGMASAGLPPDEKRGGPIGFDEMRPGCWQLDARLADMDANGVERSLCFPTFPRFCGQVFLEAVETRHEDPELALACVRAYNDWMVEEWADESGGRLIPCIIVPLWDPQLAADEIRRNAARGVHAVTFSEMPQYLGLPSLYNADRHWDPFLQACDETETVVCLHIGSASVSMRSADDSSPGANITLTSINSQFCMTDWVMSGALARFPRLKLAFSESQVGWMPYHIQRMDVVWRKFHESPVAGIPPEMTVPPSEYVRGRVFGCVVEDDIGLRGRGIGVDQLTFESDYPHMDSSWPHTRDYAAQALSDYSEEEIEKVTRGN